MLSSFTFLTASLSRVRLIALLLAVTTVSSLGGFSLAQDQDKALVVPPGQTIHEVSKTVPAVVPPHSEAVEREEHGLPQASPVLWHLGPLPINSSMVLTWTVAIGIIAFAQYATRRIKEVPDGAQNFWEFLVESLRDFLESIIGRELVKKTFWFFATIFIFILFSNWFGLLPGVGTIGWGHADASGDIAHITTPLLRGANADLNLTLAMSAIFFACWIFWALQANGPGGFLLHIFGPKGQMQSLFGRILMGIIFALVGLLEVVSILFRPVSLSFRLYGNIFAGENMLESMSKLVPLLAGIIPIPFYFMELLVGFVQALVFMLLTAVFTLLICSHGEEPHGGKH